MANNSETTAPLVVVVGAGISGLAAGWRLKTGSPELQVLVVDKASRPGGMIETEISDGLTIEHGPEGVVTTKPEAVDLINAVGLRNEIVVDGPAPRRTFVVRDGTLAPLPYGILNPTRKAASNLMRSPLLGPLGKLRLALEPVLPRRRITADESVDRFIRRRFGRGLLDAIVEPLIGGIHGDRASRLSAEMLLPALRGIEQRGRSVAFKALRTNPRPDPTRLPPLVTLRQGMASFTDHLAGELGDSLKLDTQVESLERDGDRWQLRLRGGAELGADAVILALPARPCAGLLEPHDVHLARFVKALPSSGSQTVTLIWDQPNPDHVTDGTGFLVPFDEQRYLAACTWVTSKWHFRSDGDSTIYRCFMRVPDASEERLVELALVELERLMGPTPPPVRTIVRQVDDALPIMEVGHRARVEAIVDRASALGNFALAGAGLEGSGLPACIRSGNRAAETVARALGPR